MIEDIRKKHEADKSFLPINRKYLSSSLSMADVDQLFAALDAERGKVRNVLRELCIMIEHYDAFDELSDDEKLMLSDIERFKQILTGEGK